MIDFGNTLAYMQRKPATVPEGITSNNISSKVNSLLLLPDGINCPDETVIVKRTTMQDLIYAQRLKSVGFNGPRHFLTERNNTDGTGQYYVRTILCNHYFSTLFFLVSLFFMDFRLQRLTMDLKVFTGVKGHLNLWEPQVSQDQISLAFIAVAGGPKERFASIFVGWMVSVISCPSAISK